MKMLGLDPGQTGGIAIVDPERLVVYAALRMPSLAVRKKQMVNPRAIISWYEEHGPVDLGIIENVHSMPKQGVASSFQFGRMFGGAEALLVGMMKTEHIDPRVWKHGLGLGSSKSAARDYATRVYGTDEHWPLAKDDGVAEAALIPIYWYRKYGAPK